MNYKTIIDSHINNNYFNYLKIIKNSNNFKNSKIKDYLEDILNDTILELIEKNDYELLYNKLNTKTTFISGLNNMLDGLIIYIVNINLVSNTSKFYRMYKNNNTTNEYNLDYVEDCNDNYLEKIDLIEEILNSIDFKYKYKKELFKERWNLDKEHIEKITYVKLSEKYKINYQQIYLIIKEIEEKIQKEIKKL